MTATQSAKLTFAGLASYVRTVRDESTPILVFRAASLGKIEESLAVAERVATNLGIQVQVVF